MWIDIIRKKIQFTYRSDAGIEDHGPLMLYQIFTKLNPSTNIKIDVLTARLKKIQMHHHGQDVMKMLDTMDLLHNKIKEIDVPVAHY